MKVAELIEKLKAFPQDAEVITEGCDCIGDTHGVELDEDGEVLIFRQNDGVFYHDRRTRSKDENAADK